MSSSSSSSNSSSSRRDSPQCEQLSCHSTDPVEKESDESSMEIGKEKQVAQKTEDKTVPLQKEKERENDKKGKRQLIDNEHVGTLVRDYWKYFVDFSKGRKERCKQLIPGKVWQKVYANYKLKHPNSPFQEESLKEHLRVSVKDMKLGVNNPEVFEGGTLQDEELMGMLVSTDGWKARNLLKTTFDAADGSAGPERNSGENIQPCASGQLSSQAEVRPPPAAGQTNKSADRPPTKSKILKRAREDISEILSEVKSLIGDRKDDFEARRRLAEARAALFDAKRRECEERLNFQRKQNILTEIEVLKKQRALDLITDEEFIEKCKVVFGS